ncbi:MAG: hypothetical protein MHM6MM_002079 [Cercozoa sp. M6MM]
MKRLLLFCMSVSTVAASWLKTGAKELKDKAQKEYQQRVNCCGVDTEKNALRVSLRNADDYGVPQAPNMCQDACCVEASLDQGGLLLHLVWNMPRASDHGHVVAPRCAGTDGRVARIGAWPITLSPPGQSDQQTWIAEVPCPKPSELSESGADAPAKLTRSISLLQNEDAFIYLSVQAVEKFGNVTPELIEKVHEDPQANLEFDLHMQCFNQIPPDYSGIYKFSQRDSVIRMKLEGESLATLLAAVRTASENRGRGAVPLFPLPAHNRHNVTSHSDSDGDTPTDAHA